MCILKFMSWILICLIININANDVHDGEIYYPPLWDMAPSSLADFPLVNDSSSQYRLIDPWYYPHRLGLYKILVNISTPFMPFASSSNASNIFFALPSQFGWLYLSNRLFTNGTFNMSINSWWASANYYLAVIPFLTAMDTGLITREPFQIVQRENFCTNFAECFTQIPNAMAEWTLFFVQLEQSASCIGSRKVDHRIIEKCYLTQMWQAYKSSIYGALPLVEDKIKYLPSSVEQLFGTSWGKLINLISLTRKNTNLYETVNNQRQFLPFRMLDESDRFLNATDLQPKVIKSLKVLFSFRFDWLSFIEKVWGRITCNFESRVYAQLTLDNMAVSRFRALNYLAKAMYNAFAHECDRLPDRQNKNL